MNKEILDVVELFSSEKGVSKDIIFGAIEAALAMATKRHSREDIESRVKIDRQTGNYETFRCWEVVDVDGDGDGEEGEGEGEREREVEFPSRQIRLQDVLEEDPELKIGDFIEKPIESIEFGRIAAQTAKQVIVQKVREAERIQIVEAFSHRIGEMLGGTVKRIESGNVYLDMGGNAEGLIARESLIPRESFRPGDRIRAYLQEVRSEPRGPQLFLSRTVPELLIELFKLEVPEVNEGLIEIISGARDPGIRAKIMVKANDPRIDPIGACVGMRGSRVQAVSNELAGERVDIIPWHENPAQFVINAMAPVEIASIVVDEEMHSMDISVEEENLSQAIGRGGQNVRLASELSGWVLNIMSVEQAEEKNEAENQVLQKIFMEQLDIDEEMSLILVQEGFSSIEEIAYVPEEEMLNIEEFDSVLVNELRGRARDIMLARAITSEEKLVDAQPAEDLLQMEGIEDSLAYELAAAGVVTMNDLADLSVSELMEIDSMDDERAGKLIMTARRPWFEENEGGKTEDA